MVVLAFGRGGEVEPDASQLGGEFPAEALASQADQVGALGVVGLAETAAQFGFVRLRASLALVGEDRIPQAGEPPDQADLFLPER